MRRFQISALELNNLKQIVFSTVAALADMFGAADVEDLPSAFDEMQAPVLMISKAMSARVAVRCSSINVRDYVRRERFSSLLSETKT